MRHYFQGTSSLCCGGKCSSSALDEEKEKKVDEIAKAEEHEKIEEIKKALRLMSNEELDEEILKIRDELQQIKEENQTDPKQSKSASSEFVGVDNHTSKYQILTLQPYEKETHSGDALLIKLGSKNDSIKGNSDDDKFLQSLGSVD